MANTFSVSESYPRYVAGFIDLELRKSIRRARETVRRELWSAATHDHFSQTGEIRPLLDAMGVSLREALDYKSLIDAELDRFVQLGFVQGTRQDPLFHDAKAFVLAAGEANAVHLQRYLKIGFNQAVGLIEAMEGDILSPMDAEGNRSILNV